MTPKDRCLQCGKSREEVKDKYDKYCATASGYEVIETDHEWDRHHWRDWSDATLDSYGIVRGAYAEHRRDDVYALPYAPCEHTKKGHMFPREDVYFDGWLMQEKNVCVKCGKKRGN